jgi:hypothetical protein
MAILNPYLSSKSKTIVYNLTETKDGWNFEVLLPSRIPASDRIKVLEWLRQYRVAVRTMHPHWVTMLHPSKDRYLLEIRKANSDKELIAVGEQLKSICGEILEYA